MSEWHVEVVKLGPIEQHPNADRLQMTMVHGGYPVIMSSGQYIEGDLAVYIPVDSIVPDTPEYEFLKGKRRIKAKKIRGIFSQGMLAPVPLVLYQALGGCDASDLIGANVAEIMGITKFEEGDTENTRSGGEAEKGPAGWEFIKYTDLVGLKKYRNFIQPGEPVVITEKTHGCLAGFVHDGTRLWARSKKEIKRPDPKTHWWAVAESLGLEEKSATNVGTIFFGEIYGPGIQDLTYGRKDKGFIVFDTYNVKTQRWNDWDTTKKLASDVGLETVPELYRGPWLGPTEHDALAEGKSTFSDHVREGFVVKPLTERYDMRLGRVAAKLVGEGYLLR